MKILVVLALTMTACGGQISKEDVQLVADAIKNNPQNSGNAAGDKVQPASKGPDSSTPGVETGLPAPVMDQTTTDSTQPSTPIIVPSEPAVENGGGENSGDDTAIAEPVVAPYLVGVQTCSMVPDGSRPNYGMESKIEFYSDMTIKGTVSLREIFAVQPKEFFKLFKISGSIAVGLDGTYFDIPITESQAIGWVDNPRLPASYKVKITKKPSRDRPLFFNPAYVTSVGHPIASERTFTCKYDERVRTQF